MYIGGFQKFSLTDFPEKLSCIVFTQGCNFRCGYCHNPELAELSTNTILENDILEFLKKRQGKLDGVVITGGEPTLQRDLPEFIKKIKDFGFLVKLDTNGTNPSMLEKLINENLLDYIAMDIKAPINKYIEITNAKADFNNILTSINLIKNSGVGHEFRTTVVKEQLTPVDIEQIILLTKGSLHYFQKFAVSKHIDESFNSKNPYIDIEFQEIISNLKDKGINIKLR